jgi:hypothetical protein
MASSFHTQSARNRANFVSLTQTVCECPWLHYFFYGSRPDVFRKKNSGAPALVHTIFLTPCAGQYDLVQSKLSRTFASFGNYAYDACFPCQVRAEKNAPGSCYILTVSLHQGTIPLPFLATTVPPS